MTVNTFYKSLIVAVGLLCYSVFTLGQINESYRYTYPEFKNNEAGNLYFRLENNNFLRNNEFFGAYTEGYTLPGYIIQPTLMYYAGSKVRFKIGTHLVKYSGIKEFTEVVPVVSAHIKLSEYWDMVLGNINGDIHHRLIEPLFNTEWQYFRPTETGVQFYHNSPRLWLDTWIDWEQFIFRGDEIPEMFTGGISLDYKITKDESVIDISLPLQFTASHLGGQISNYEIESYSLVNVAAGFKVSKDIKASFIRKLTLATYFCGYNDLTDALGLPFKKGNAIYPVAIVKHKFGEVMMGYWNSSNFFSPKGSALFYSISDHNENIYNKNRQLITNKFTFHKQLMKKVTFSAQAETYLDVNTSELEYSYGISLIFTPNFFLKNIGYQ